MSSLPSLLTVAALLPLAGCRVIAGVEDREGASHDPDAAPAAPGEMDAAVWTGPEDAYPAACRSCIAEQCASELRACAEDAACDEGHRCMRGRVDPVGATVCSQNAPETALLLAQTLAGCVSTECLAGCAPEMPWSCVHNYAWPRPAVETATLSMTLVGYYRPDRLPADHPGSRPSCHIAQPRSCMSLSAAHIQRTKRSSGYHDGVTRFPPLFRGPSQVRRRCRPQAPGPLISYFRQKAQTREGATHAAE